MNILVVGWLEEASHQVTPMRPAALRRLFPELCCIAADYGRDSAETWVSRLAGVDVVINAAWLISETAGVLPRRPISARVEGRPDLGPFVYRNRGTMATIGRSAAVADFGTVQLTGCVAWLL